MSKLYTLTLTEEEFNDVKHVMKQRDLKRQKMRERYHQNKPPKPQKDKSLNFEEKILKVDTLNQSPPTIQYPFVFDAATENSPPILEQPTLHEKLQALQMGKETQHVNFQLPQQVQGIQLPHHLQHMYLQQIQMQMQGQAGLPINRDNNIYGQVWYPPPPQPQLSGK